MGQKRWIIISNRLPFNISPEGKINPSSGGLVTALSGIRNDAPRIWVGTAPEGITETTWSSIAESTDQKFEPVFVSEDLYDQYYNGMCNDTIWPLFHYEASESHFKKEWWDAYEQVNKEFAKKIAQIWQPGDLIWVHDYHLFRLPKYLRELKPQIKIGFFLHIPFPSSEIYRYLPVRKEIMEGVLNSDLIGFHDYSYLRHFCAATLSILGLDSNLLSMEYQGRNIKLGVFPVSIDTQSIVEMAQSPDVYESVSHIPKEKFQFVGVDRLDYIKGVDLKLQAFANMLERYPETLGQVGLLQIAVPTRVEVPLYQRLRDHVNRLVGEINGRFGRPDWTPIRYVYSSVPQNELLALYRMSDALLVTSKRDGMNLVTMEFVAAQNKENPGVVLLSEFTGAHSVLSEAISINPWDIEYTADQMRKAIDIKQEDRVKMHESSLNYLLGYNSTAWAEDFINELSKIKNSGAYVTAHIRGEEDVDVLLERLSVINSQAALTLFVDYDGTLVPIEALPELAVLSPEKLELLKEISKDLNNNLVVVSGRDPKFLSSQLGPHFSLAAEHGGFYFDPKQDVWLNRVFTPKEVWFEETVKIMNDYARRVPKSFVEEKTFSIAWHYRLSPREYARYQANKLHEELEHGLSSLPVSILRGKKITEVRSLEANKGAFVNWYLNQDNQARVGLVIGDDQTDEDMFKAIKGHGLSIKVGEGSTYADYRLRTHEDVWGFLKILAQKVRSKDPSKVKF